MKKENIPIVVATITVIGTLGSALFVNWDKIFPPKTPTTPIVEPAQPPTPSKPPPPISETSPSSGGRWPWTSERTIQPADLSSLSLADLDLMRNEIYARHGWVFDRWELREHFEKEPWYHPKGDLANRERVNQLAEAELSPIEKNNIEIILSRESALKR